VTGTGFYVPADRFPVTLPFAFGQSAGDLLCDQIWDATREQKLVEERIRREQPVGRIWDAEWNVQHVLGSEYGAKFSWISNDTGPGQTEFPMSSPVAKWIYDYQGRMDRGEGRTVGITIDYCGARWSGILDKFAVEQREDGDTVLVVDWVADYEFLKWYSVVPNPFLPDAFQAPRAWLLAGPVTWVLRLTLFLAIWREHNPFLTWPDDPMDLNNWVTMGLDISDWHIVVKPESFIDAMASGVVWSVATSRWANFHDMAHYMVEDSEISIECRRYLPGDDEPWAGADLRYGTLVVDFVDKSGILVGTANGGNIFDGLARTAVEFADDFIDSTYDIVADADTPEDYFDVGKRYTDPVKPYVVFYEGETSPVQESSWIYSPTKGVQVAVGGHSAPGVNECLAGDTLVDGPDGKERIDVLAELGKPFQVWSITPEGNRVAATALHAFRKGYAQLFTYTLTDGRSITVTNEHRFLTPSGFKHAADVGIGDQICTVDWTRDPVDEPVRQVHDHEYQMVVGATQRVKSVTPAGPGYFYDMTVPGWENYSAHGIWNHNTISATIQAVGDILGNLVQLGSLGGTIDTLLAPLYEDCVAGDTLIDGPDGKERIDVLAERGESFRVWSIDQAGQKVPATAMFAFKKGNAELFEYVLDNGSVLKATKQHRWLTPQGWAETGKAVVGTCVGVDSSQHFSMVTSIKSLGFQDFYDMHVPGLENYLAEGIWNHNTILAWQTYKSNERANNTGWDRLFTYFQEGAGKAYTISSLMVLRAGMWATKTVISWQVSVSDGQPYLIGDNGIGHFWLDDRIGLVLKADNQIHMDRCRRIDLAWGPDTPPEWTLNVGDERIWQDPAQRALGRIERLIAGLHDLGVW
jgi:hypothetical protein